MQNKEGRDFEVHLDTLSREDQDFVRERKWLAIAGDERETEGQTHDSKQIAKAAADQGRPTGDEIRVRWLNESYDTTIYHVQGTQWAELDNKTQKIKWYATETTRNEHFVEMYNATRNQTWRLFAFRMELKDGEKWKWLSNGRWDVSRRKPAPAEP